MRRREHAQRLKSSNSSFVEGLLRVSDLPEALLPALRTLLKTQGSAVRQRWQRSLSMGDLVSDRWEKARELGFGEGTTVYDSCLVLGSVTVGRHVWIGPYTVLDGSGGLTIGDHVSISAGVQIYTHDTVRWALSGGLHEVERSAVRIGSRCYLGPNAVISRGVTIGDGCVIGANSLVNMDVPSGYRAWGTPCRLRGLVANEVDDTPNGSL